MQSLLFKDTVRSAQKFFPSRLQQEMQCTRTYNVTLRRVCATIVAVEKQ